MMLEDSLTLSEFLKCISHLKFYDKYEPELEQIFHKIDSKNIGHIDWSSVSNYFLQVFREKEHSKSLRTLPFNSIPKITHAGK